jgi:rhodanese-related sulfurtransferase/biotin operon repressor
MANAHRMEIIDLLGQGPFAVEEVASNTGMSVANASQHLQVLKTAGLVISNRKGNFIYYSLANEKVFDAWRSLRELGMEQNTKAKFVVDEFRKSHHCLEPVGTQELHKRGSKGEVLLLDVRPEEEFLRGHIHQALSIPIDQILTRIKELPKDKEIIAYCRGPFCAYADQAVELLLKNGFKANRMAEGYPDWKSRNLPVSILI